MNILEFDLNLIRALDALISERGVTRAGKVVGRSQPAMSNALSRLRFQLNDPLLSRGKEGWELTPKAEALRQPVRKILVAIENCFSGATSFDPATSSGIFRIGAPDHISLPILPPLVQRLVKNASNMDLHVVTVAQANALEVLDEGKADIVLGRITGHQSHMQTRSLFFERISCVVRSDHPIVKLGRKLDINSLLSYPHLVVNASGLRSAAFDEHLKKIGRKRRVAVSVSDFSSVPRLLECSDMIGVYAQRVSNLLKNNFDLVVVPIPPEVEGFDINMTWLARNDMDERHVWLRNQIISICDDL